MFTLQYYDHAWDGFRRFDTFGDTAFPTEVPTMRDARKVAAEYLNAVKLSVARVRVLDAEGKTVCMIRRYKNLCDSSVQEHE